MTLLSKPCARFMTIARFDMDKPLALMASFTHPHDPYAARKQFWDLYRDEDIDLPSVPHMMRDKLDAHSQRLYDVSAMDDYTVTEADVRAARHGYYANISYVDSPRRPVGRHAGKDWHVGEHHRGLHLGPW